MAERKSGRVTIRDVAIAAGVDRSTVSRAFSRPEMIHPETTARVLKVAADLGYSPNRLARALSTGRSANIALVVHDLTNPFIPLLIMGVQREADRSNYCVFIGNSDEAPESEKRLMTRFAGQVAGTILVSSRSDDATVRQFAESGLVVLVNRDIEDVPRVLIDDSRGIEQAVQHLVGLGHRRICYVGGPESSWSNGVRRDAARRACAKAGADLKELSAGRASFDAGRALVSQIASSGTTAAIAFDDAMAHGILSGLAELGVSVPAEYSVIGCDDVLGAVTYPALTSITTRADETGCAAVKMLFDRMENPEAPPVREMIQTSLVVRATTAPPGQGPVVTG